MIFHSSATLGPDECEVAVQSIENNYVGCGPAAAALEAALRADVGTAFAHVVSSGFHALALGLEALDLPKGSPIAVPVLTCGSVVAAVQRTGHRPVLCDIHPENLTLNVARIPPGCRALIAPHAYGTPVDVEAVERFGLPWIEDCATSPASSVSGRPCGSFGSISIFSFNSTKYLTGGGGGAILTNNEKFARRISALLDADARPASDLWSAEAPASWPGRLGDVNAAIALVQWNRRAEFRKRRDVIANFYREALTEFAPELRPFPARNGSSPYRFLVRTRAVGENWARALRDAGIDARSQINPWMDRRTVSEGIFPGADEVRDHLLSLPIYPSMDDAMAAEVVRAVAEVAEKL